MCVALLRIWVLFGLAATAWGEGPGGQPSTGAAGSGAPVLTIAVREVPPFAYRDSAGNWEGLSVDLWQDVADRLNISFDWRELSLVETWRALQSGQVDGAVAALSVTVDRERRFDFSHPYHIAGLAPAYASGTPSAWFDTLRAFLSWQFLSAVGSLMLVLLIAGALIWLFERKANAEEFGGGDTVRGLGDGFWWSAVTMTTVGYGDKAPKTLGGRIVGLVWMFMSLIIIAGFTASIAASLTANQLANDSVRSTPIGELRVGVLRDSAAYRYAENQGARVRAYEKLDLALEALGENRVDVVVHDAPILKYRVRQAFDDVEVDDRVLVRDDYAFAFTDESGLRERVNLALLSILHQPVWQDIKRRYLGADGGAL